MSRRRTRTPRSILPISAALLALSLSAASLISAPGPADAGTAGAAALPTVGTAFADDGPYQVTETDNGTTTYYHPTGVGDGGAIHPVILWGNGTGAPTASYDGLLRHFASHGFIVAAANTTNAGTGQEMLAGIDGIAAIPELAAGADLEHIGATGHSQGAGGAVMTGADPRVDTVFPLEGCFGGSRSLDGKTALFFAGENDTIVSPSLIERCFTGAGYPAAFAEAAGASHFTPAMNGGVFRGAATAWARWQLAGDAEAATWFVGDAPVLASSGEWSRFETNPALQALGTAAPAPTTPPVTDPPADPAPSTTTTQPSSGGGGSVTPPTLEPVDPGAPGSGGGQPATSGLLGALAVPGTGPDANPFDHDLFQAGVATVLAARPDSPLAVLSRGDQPVTALLPIDHAFRSLVRDLTGEAVASEADVSAALTGLGVDQLERILLYHVVPGTAMTGRDALTEGSALATGLDGAALTVGGVGRILPLVRVGDGDPATGEAFVLWLAPTSGGEQIGYLTSAVLRPPAPAAAG